MSAFLESVSWLVGIGVDQSFEPRMDSPIADFIDPNGRNNFCQALCLQPISPLSCQSSEMVGRAFKPKVDISHFLASMRRSKAPPNVGRSSLNVVSLRGQFPLLRRWHRLPGQPAC